MRQHGDQIRLSASDLMRFTACPHAVRLDLAWLQGESLGEDVGEDFGEDFAPIEDSEDAALFQQHGDEHERAYLQRLEAEGKHVVRIDTEHASFEASQQATREALAAGPDVIFQAALGDGMWGGYADFLERVPVPSDLGAFSYEVVDTKLKRKPAPGHVLQLALYSDLLADIQGHPPEQAHIVLGTGERVHFRLSEYAAYARLARERLADFVQNPPKTRPVPCALCDLCRWRDHCGDAWRNADSLYLTAGITKSQVVKLEAAGVQTLAALAERETRVKNLAAPTLDKLRVQARLQHARKRGEPMFALRPPAPGKGFARMPRPDPCDLFYDIEGDPFYSEPDSEADSEADSEGLEYLHGVWDGKDFTALWAHNLAEEKDALVALFGLFGERLLKYPNAHIYHYAPYEITALRRLAMRHGIGEALLDQWLRERRFVDLYAVVRGGVFASEPSYSLKDLEAFYDMPRTGEVKTAGGSIVAYEKWRETGDPEILREIEEYNRIDCISTEKMRAWLLEIRRDGPWLEMGESDTANSVAQQAENEALLQLLNASDLPESRRRILYDLGVFHDRERKPQAWAVFDSAAKEFEDLCDDMECLAGLEAVRMQRVAQMYFEREYRYPPQETKLREGGRAQVVLDGRFASVEILQLDRRRRRISLKMNAYWGNKLPDHLHLIPNFGIPPGDIPYAIRKVIKDQCGPRSNRAAGDLLSRNAPRFEGPPPLPLDDGAATLGGLIAAVRALDQSVLPVQGPPGTGKTYAAARAILALVQAGQRVAVSANSHEAIRNVLMGCAQALHTDEIDLAPRDVHIAHKISARENHLPDEVLNAISCVTRNNHSALRSADIVGGTAWLFSRDAVEGAFDYLFVDEAGQVSLANLVAMSNAARNIVLIGDPRQLPQPLQGAHPHPANLSCLDWVLGPGQNVAPERGVFLPETWRMHPDLCTYISSQFYEGRLESHPSTALQSVEARDVPCCGAWRVSVPHEGRAQICPEEIEAISETIDRLLEGSWTDQHGTRPICEDDIIIVAPYNAQVNALSDALPDIRIGTVDKFQGKEAPIALVSLTASSSEETSRGIDFLLSRERLNVAISRGKALSLVFASPRLLHTNVATVEQMRLVNAVCGLGGAGYMSYKN